MKKILPIFILLLTVSCSQKEANYVDYKQIVFRADIAYEINSDTPFTGIRADYWDNGQAKKRETYREGIKDGPFESLTSNGEFTSRTIWQNGEVVADEIYYENGNLWSRTNFDPESGEVVSDESYWENGKLSSRSFVKDGEITFEFYDEEGKLEEL